MARKQSMARLERFPQILDGGMHTSDAPAKARPTCFTHLPREVRDQVFHYLLFDPRGATLGRGAARLWLENPIRSISGTGFFDKKVLLPPDIFAIGCVSKALRAEAIQIYLSRNMFSLSPVYEQAQLALQLPRWISDNQCRLKHLRWVYVDVKSPLEFLPAACPP